MYCFKNIVKDYIFLYLPKKKKNVPFGKRRLENTEKCFNL